MSPVQLLSAREDFAGEQAETVQCPEAEDTPGVSWTLFLDVSADTRHICDVECCEGEQLQLQQGFLRQQVSKKLCLAQMFGYLNICCC